MSRADRPEVGLGFTAQLPMTEGAARAAGETWLAEWGDSMEQTGVTVSYFDAGLNERELRVQRPRWWQRFLYSLRWAGTVWGSGQVR